MVLCVVLRRVIGVVLCVVLRRVVGAEVLNQLAAMRKQLLNERRRIEGDLNKPQVLASGIILETVMLVHVVGCGFVFVLSDYNLRKVT